ncbi:MAG: prolipoprotein diacylglyceryl transferase [Victivallaceae bacterium]|nr:prolipoprotein diacylglyceryl transferase [Victivallaceae bacterium]
MNPIAFQIGALQVRWYGVMAALGFLAATWIVNRCRKHADLTSDQVSSMLLVTIISGVIGARIFYVVQFFDEYRDNLWEIVRIDHGGLVFYGGFLAIPVLWIWSKVQKRDFIRLLDLAAIALVLGHAFGRVGCFLNGCCYGKVTHSALGVIYPKTTAPEFQDGLARYPIQLFETAENLVVLFILLAIVKKGKRGTTVAAYFVLYGILRFINEFFRGDNYHYFGLFTIAQLIGIVLVPTGALLYWYFDHGAREKN